MIVSEIMVDTIKVRKMLPKLDWVAKGGIRNHLMNSIDRRRCSRKFEIRKIIVEMRAEKFVLRGVTLWILILDGNTAIFHPAVS